MTGSDGKWLAVEIAMNWAAVLLSPKAQNSGKESVIGTRKSPVSQMISSGALMARTDGAH